MKKYLPFILLSTSLMASSLTESVKRFTWDDQSVTWLRDDKFPRFSFSIYFEGGALGEKIPGLTHSTFDLLTAGTSRENQNQLNEFFEFYGARLKSNVTHETSILTLSGLIKDLKPLTQKFCEVLKEANYPMDKVSSYQARAKSQIKSLVNSHGALADRAYRRLSLKGTPYELPVEGSLETLAQIETKGLKQRLLELRTFKKRIYLSGPKEVLELKDYLTSDCLGKGETSLSQVTLKKPEPQDVIYLVTVPEANQAQIRLGRYMTRPEFQAKEDEFSFFAGFLGGGFTSKLIQELRVKRGLTYSASAYVSGLRQYGRAGVSTFSKNETATEAINVIRDIFDDLIAKKILPEELNHQKGFQKGSHPFQFEDSQLLLSQIAHLDLMGRPMSDLVDYPQKVDSMTINILARSAYEIFPWEKQTIVVVGDKSLEKSLSKIRPVKIIPYTEFL